jgi:hypothetical protein
MVNKIRTAPPADIDSVLLPEAYLRKHRAEKNKQKAERTSNQHGFLSGEQTTSTMKPEKNGPFDHHRWDRWCPRLSWFDRKMRNLVCSDGVFRIGDFLFRAWGHKRS